MQRNASTEKFQAVVTRVKLANKVVRSLQFHTTRTVARAIDGPDSAPKRVGGEGASFAACYNMKC